MALYVGVACSRRRDLFKFCPHRRFTFTSGQSPITPTYDFCYKRRAIRSDHVCCQPGEHNVRASNRKYESMQNQSTAVFPSRSTIGKIETIPQMEMTLKMFAPNAILNQQC